MKFNISTTNSLEGYKIDRYLGVVSAHIVAGTGLFSDIAASLTDVFGGRSESYQKQLISIKNEVLQKLESDALLLGANSIVGLKLDFDEISGKAKSMFMVSGIGTAVKLRALSPETQVVQEKSILPNEDLELIMRRDRVINKIKENVKVPNEYEWTFITSNKVIDVLDILSKEFCNRYDEQSNILYIQDNEFFVNFKNYLISISIPENIEKLYALLTINHSHLNNLVLRAVEETNNISYNTMIKLFVENKLKPKQLPKLTTCNPLIYLKSDIFNIIALKEYLADNYAEKAQTFEKRGLLSTKPTNYWNCINGHKNSTEITDCSECGIDRFGYKKGEMNPTEAISILDKKIKALDKYFGFSI